MLTRNCQETIVLLITEEDFNVRLTIAKNASLTKRYVQKTYVEKVWKEYIRDSMGEALNKATEYAVDCFVVKDNKLEKYSATILGTEIINHFWEQVKDADGVRFTATQAIGKSLSWIIVRA